jgi:Ca2+/H+ antiporter
MEPEFLFWFALTIKMVVTALFVTLATVIAERLGPTVGALVATLPVSAGPVYVFLALDHDAAFISAMQTKARNGSRHGQSFQR